MQCLEQRLSPWTLSVNVIDEDEDRRVWVNKHGCFLRIMCYSIMKRFPN